MIKRSLKRGNRNSLPSIPTFSEDDSELIVSAETIQTSEDIVPELVVETELETHDDMFDLEPPSTEELVEIRTLLEEPLKTGDEINIAIESEEFTNFTPLNPIENDNLGQGLQKLRQLQEIS